MREGYLRDSDEFLTVEDALELITRYRNYPWSNPSLSMREIFSREKIEVELREAYESGTVTLQDEESMRVGNPSKHLDLTRQRVTVAIKSSLLAAIATTLYISFADFEAFALYCFVPYKDVDELCDGYRFAIYDVENELGYTIRGAARALAKKYSISERAMGERIFDAAEQGKLQVSDPQTGLAYIPKDRSYRHERISVSDLNQWLEESGVPYQLGDAADEPTATAATRARGINRKEVMRIFSVNPRADQNRIFWDDKLGRPPEWLKAARTVTGKPGRSSRWDPLLVAHALLGKGHMDLGHLDSAIHEHLHDLLEQWKAETDDQRYKDEETDD